MNPYEAGMKTKSGFRWTSTAFAEGAPSHLPPRPILYRLGDMRRLDLLAAGLVGDGACQLEHAVIGPRAQMQLLHTRTCAASAGVAALVRFRPPSSTWQNWRISAGPISALPAMAVPSKRRRWISRAASTRARTTALGSPNRSSDSFSYLTAGTSTWMSIPQGGCALPKGGCAYDPSAVR